MAIHLEFKARALSLTTVIIPDNDIDSLHEALAKKLSHSPQNFFTATAMVADLSHVGSVSSDWLGRLKTCFKNNKLTLVGITSHQIDATILQSHELADIPVSVRQNRSSTGAIAESASKKVDMVFEPTQYPENKIVRGNVRSGQRVYAASGDLIVIGTVGAGAEVIADGNVHIFGSLRGRAFAGARGNEDSHIFASDFSAELVSIAGSYQNMEQLEPYKNGKNCLVTLNKDETMLIVSL